MPIPDSAGDGKENTISKSAAFVVISGISMSILKAAISPFIQPRSKTEPSSELTQPKIAELTLPKLAESAQLIPVPPKELIVSKKPEPFTSNSEIVSKPKSVPKTPESQPRRSVEIVKGDTLWGLSRKYGVSIDAIKNANELSSDKIYAGKKLIIP